MKRLAICCIAVLGLLPATAQLQVKELKLQNGMTVWLNEDHSQPKVFGAVVVKAGAKDCPNTGIAHYFEHIMFKGTNRLGTIDYYKEKPWLDSISAQYDLLAQTKEEAERNRIQQHINRLSLHAADYIIPNEFNRLVTQYGGSGLNAATSYDATYYYNSFLPQYIKQWCTLNAERLIAPVFRGFQSELENVYEEKNRAADAMGDAMERVMRAVFKTQPYAYPIIGSTESLKNPRLSEMEAFYKKYYVAANMGLILSGDITPSDTLTALLEQTFGRVQQGDVPDRTLSPMPTIQQGERYDVVLPIPIVGIKALIYRAPTDFAPDAEAFQLANLLLSNEKAGMLDSLTNEHVVMGAAAMSLSLADASGTALLMVPKVPFGKMKNAEAACMEQVRRVMRGDFSDEQLLCMKQQMIIDAERELETIERRSQLMIEVFSQGHTWQEQLDKVNRIRQLSKQDVVNAAQKYYGAHYITLQKKYGNPDKETLKQPGYRPIAPKNANAKSALARELELMPVSSTHIPVVDFERDATTLLLTDHATLYYKENPVNDIFTFVLRYQNGKLHTPKLASLASYLQFIGTDSLKKQQLERAWQRIGVKMEPKCGQKTFTLELTGPDQQLKPALALLHHFLTAAKGDKEAIAEMRTENKITHKSFNKQKDNSLMPLIERVTYGQRSTYLTQVSKSDMQKLTDEELLQLFREVQQYDCELFYCGRQPIEQVAQAVQQELPLSTSHRQMADTHRRIEQYDEPIVFFYDVPKSRQNYVISYDAIDALPTARQRAVERLWRSYFGGGMSSVLFQNIREFRSLAYSTYGTSYVPALPQHADEPLAFLTVTGTQADKTRQVMGAVDSLLRQLPMKEENLNAARQQVLNNIQNNYPSFRNVAPYIANQRMRGYAADPNSVLMEHLPLVAAADVVAFHKQYIAPNRHRVWMVIGDKKLTRMEDLAPYGRVIELRKEDIFK